MNVEADSNLQIGDAHSPGRTPWLPGNQGPALYNRLEIFQEIVPDNCFFSSLQGGKNLGVGLFFLNELPNLVVTTSDIGLLRSNRIRGKQQQKGEEKDRNEKRDLPKEIFMESRAFDKKGFHHLSLR